MENEPKNLPRTLKTTPTGEPRPQRHRKTEHKKHNNMDEKRSLRTNNYQESSKRTQTPTTATTLQTKSSCFIATAAYGTPMAQEIKTLRRFRDSRMESNLVARHFVTLYYNTSPLLARVISRNKKMKVFVRLSLKPIIRLLKSNDST